MTIILHKQQVGKLHVMVQFGVCVLNQAGKEQSYIMGLL